MEIKEYQAVIEAVLFASGEPVSVDRLAEILELDTLSRSVSYFKFRYAWILPISSSLSARSKIISSAKSYWVK